MVRKLCFLKKKNWKKAICDRYISYEHYINVVFFNTAWYEKHLSSLEQLVLLLFQRHRGLLWSSGKQQVLLQVCAQHLTELGCCSTADLWKCEFTSIFLFLRCSKFNCKRTAKQTCHGCRKRTYTQEVVNKIFQNSFFFLMRILSPCLSSTNQHCVFWMHLVLCS